MGAVMRPPNALAALPVLPERAPFLLRDDARARKPAWRRSLPGMLPLYVLAIGSAAALTTRLDLGAWPLLIALACTLLNLVTHQE
jgi:hypothetical protein